MDSSNLRVAEAQAPRNDPNLVSAFQELSEHLPATVLQYFLSTLVPTVENSFRKIVKEQLDLATEKIIAEVLKRVSGNETLTSELQHLELKFRGKVCQTIYTGEDIKGGGGENSFVQVALVDADENIVKSGPEASSEVEISAIPDHDEGSQKQQMMKLPILSKNNQLKLKDGVADLKNVKFKHIEKWTMDRRMKLLARIIGNNIDKGCLTVKHAISESFLVRDRRNLYKKKPFIPLLSGEVGQLRGIRNTKKLRELLEKEKIKSVKDFSICYNTEPQRLQQMLGISKEKLVDIVDHAKKCKIPENQYIYDYRCSRGRKMAVVFDAIGCIRGLIEADHQFIPVNNLSEEAKGEAKKMVISAFQNWENVKNYDDEASISVFPSQEPIDAQPSSSATAGIPTVYDQTVDGLFPTSSSQFNTSDSSEYPNLLDDFFDDCEFFAMTEPNDLPNGTGGVIPSFFKEGTGGVIPSSFKAKTRWKMLFSVLRWFKIRRLVWERIYLFRLKC